MKELIFQSEYIIVDTIPKVALYTGELILEIDEK